MLVKMKALCSDLRISEMSENIYFGISKMLI